MNNPAPHTRVRQTLHRQVPALSLMLAVAVSSAPLWAQSPPAADKGTSKPALTVQVTTATTQAVSQLLSGNGTVAPWQEAVVGAEVGGLRVAELRVNVGERVRKGQVLATFARESVQTDLQMAQAAVSEARIATAEAKADGDRARQLRGTGTLSEQQIQQLLWREQSTEARLKSTEAQLAAQQLRIAQTALKAPDDGIVSARSATIGSVMNPGAEMFRLIRQGRIEWRGEFTAAELEQVRPGQTVRVTSPSGSVWRGLVRQTAPTVDSVTRRGLVYVDITSPENPGSPPMRPGAYVRGELSVGEQTRLVVPQSALVARDGFHLVYVVGQDLKVHQRKVRIGRLVDNRQEILSGVQPGERLVASGGAFLSEGDTVKLATAAPAPTPAASAAR